MTSTVASLAALIKQEEGLAPVSNMEELRTRLTQRETILQQLKQLETEYKTLREHIRRLPALPPLETILWAQSVRAMPNVVFLEIDTTGLSEDAEIIRLLVLDKQGDTLLNDYVRPAKPVSAQILQITGIERAQLDGALHSIEDALAQIRQVLQGKYVLSYNIGFDIGKLKEATQRQHLPEIVVIGEDLMARAMHYFHLSSYPKLDALCQQIGQPLPPQPHQTAMDRAKGQAALLTAIADVMPMKPVIQEAPFDEGDLDEHPF